MRIPPGLHILLLALATLAIGARASSAASDAEMNGYTMRQFGNFERDWKLVTVRFRKDTGELRFTYANPIAWQSLQRNRIEYPDGAVFAKIGAMTQPDLAFPSSAVPSGTQRVQFMVRNTARHASTDGWGYALFDREGRRFPDRPDTQAAACAACHRIVPERGFVFSQIMGPALATGGAGHEWSSRLKFEDQPVAALPAALRAQLPPSTRIVRMLAGDLRKSMFTGTLDEIQPLLAQEAAARGKPSVLVSIDGTRFSAAFGDSARSCPAGTTAIKGLHTLPAPASALFVSTLCQESGH